MPRLSVKLQLAGGERSFDELHLQRRIDGTEWRPVRSVCGRQVPVCENSNRDVLWRLSVPAVKRHEFWYNIRRTVGIPKQCKLHLVYLFQWFDQSLVLVIPYGIWL
jgi:hypothetical protein